VLHENTINLATTVDFVRPESFSTPGDAAGRCCGNRGTRAPTPPNSLIAPVTHDNPFGSLVLLTTSKSTTAASGGPDLMRTGDMAQAAFSRAGDEFTFGNSFQFVRFFHLQPDEIYSKYLAPPVAWERFRATPGRFSVCSCASREAVMNSTNSGLNSRHGSLSR